MASLTRVAVNERKQRIGGRVSLKPIIEIMHVSKRYGSLTVLEDVSLEIYPGEVVGLIGSNGAGKTTLLRILAGLVRPSSGNVRLGGQDLADDWGTLPVSLGVLFEPPGLLPNLTGLDNLLTLAAVRGQLRSNDVQAWMEKVGLDPRNRQRVGKYSQGMKKRLGIAQALMENPQILVFDEPTNGLDPEAINQFASWLREAQAGGAAIIVAGHDLTQIARVCERVWRVERGKLVPTTLEGVDPATESP